MSYILGAAKIIEVGGIQFEVKTPWYVFNAWKQSADRFLARAAEVYRALIAEGGEPSEASRAALVELDQQEAALIDDALAFVVGWQGVKDEAGAEVPFSQNALRQIDWAVIKDLYGHLSDHGQQVAEAVQAGN